MLHEFTGPVDNVVELLMLACYLGMRARWLTEQRTMKPFSHLS